MGRCPNSTDGTRAPFAPITAASQSCDRDPAASRAESPTHKEWHARGSPIGVPVVDGERHRGELLVASNERRLDAPVSVPHRSVSRSRAHTVQRGQRLDLCAAHMTFARTATLSAAVEARRRKLPAYRAVATVMMVKLTGRVGAT
jgi:hypothetical protein